MDIKWNGSKRPNNKNVLIKRYKSCANFLEQIFGYPIKSKEH